MFELPKTRTRRKSGEFGRFVEQRVTSSKLSATEETRMAMVQGVSKTHAFLIFKDLDGVW